MKIKKNVAQNVTKNVTKTKEKAQATVTQVITHAKDSLKLLEALEKQTKRVTNDKIIAGFHKLGIASQAEVDELKARIIELETQLAKLTGKTQAPTPAPQEVDAIPS
jgi:polyhydroxyalkanoate synthesis regulator phasin